MGRRLVTDAERRARLGTRHRIRPGDRAATVEDATRDMVCLHATDPPTVYLSAFARVEGLTVDDVDRALYVDRSVVKLMAMRRTLFVFPRASASVALAAASARVATEQRRVIVRDIEKAELADDGAAWFDAACAAVLAALAGGREASATELRAELSELQGSMVFGEGRTWGGAVSFGPRVLTALSAAGAIVRGSNDGHWRLSKPRWVRMEAWLGEAPAPVDADEAHDELVRQWLATFGPGTDRDVAWWLGGTLGAVRGSLGRLGAVDVDLEDGSTGWVLPDDVDPVEAPEPWAALLPVLDPTTMGWKERDWYLGPHKPWIFDSVGNAGSTAWWDGRIVGGWHQDPDGAVEVALLDDVGTDARRALDAEAARLTTWLDGVRLSTVWASPLMKAHAATTKPAPKGSRR